MSGTPSTPTLSPLPLRPTMSAPTMPSSTSTTRSISSMASSCGSSYTTYSSKIATRTKEDVRRKLLNNLGIFNGPPGSAAGAGTNTPCHENPAIARKINILRAMGLGGMPTRTTPTTTSIPNSDLDFKAKIIRSSISSEPLKYKADSLPSSRKEGTSKATKQCSRDANSTNTASENDSTNNNDNSSSKSNNNTNSSSSSSSSSRRICFDDSVAVVPIPMRSEYSDRVRSRLWSSRYEIHENATRNAIEFAAEGWDWRSVTEDEGMFVCTASGELIHPVHCQQ